MSHATGKTLVRNNTMFIIPFKNASFIVLRPISIAHTVLTCIYRIYPYTIICFVESNSRLYISFDSVGRDVL